MKDDGENAGGYGGEDSCQYCYQDGGESLIFSCLRGFADRQTD